jgi:dUTP pyrophosphatase
MQSAYNVLIQRLPNGEDLPLPQKMSQGASGYDLYAANQQTVTIAPGERALIPTGFALGMPHGLEAQIRPRSGLAFKYGITTLNSPGTVDADYRGEIKVLLINHGSDPFHVQRGERIAQMVFQHVPDVHLQQSASLDDTIRGAGGFGHTGL